MAYGKYRKSYRRRRGRKKTSRRRRRVVRSARRYWRSRYRRRSKFNKVSLSIFSKGSRPNYVRTKVNLIIPDVATNPFNPSDARWGEALHEDVVYGLGPVSIFYISYGPLFKNYIKASDKYWESVHKQLYNDYADKYRYYRISGVKIKFYPKYNVPAVPFVPTYTTSLQEIGGVSVQLPIGGDYGPTGTIDTALAATNIKPEYDPVSRKSIGFAAPYLSISSKPFSSLTHNDLPKYMNSNYRKLIFKGGYQSVYCKFYRGTADTLSQSAAGGGTSSQVLVGWRPTTWSGGDSTDYGFHSFDEQGLAVMVPLNWRSLNIRYTVSITFYFKFLYEKGVTLDID